jgi:YD repeat-containing protein
VGIDLRRLAKALLLVALLFAGAAQAASVQYVYDDLGRLVAVLDPSGQTTLYTYDAAGNLLSVSNNASSQLSIVAFAPNHGKAGDTVTIIGSAFIANPAQNTVSFNGTPATVSTATATTLVAVVPAGAMSGPISVSNVNGTATSANAFTIVEPPVIAAVTPNVVGRGGATRVEISGSNLAFATAVTFTQAGITATLLPGATSQTLPIIVTVSGSVPAGVYSFSVVDSAGTTNSGAVTLAVGLPPTGDSMTVTRPVSVFLPQPAQLAPTSGDSMTVANPVSVFLPPQTPLPPPTGDSMSLAQPVSVSMP